MADDGGFPAAAAAGPSQGQQPAAAAEETFPAEFYSVMRHVSFFTTAGLLLCSLVLNTYVMANVCYKRKTQVAYFVIFILFCLAHVVHFLVAALVESIRYFKDWAALQEFMEPYEKFPAPLAKGTLGLLFLLVAALTIERFLAGTVRNGIIRGALHWVTTIVSFTVPCLVVAFHILSLDSFRSELTDKKELWFGLEVGL